MWQPCNQYKILFHLAYYIHTPAHWYIHTDTHMCMRVHTHTYTHACTHTHMYTHNYTLMHTHTHTSHVHRCIYIAHVLCQWWWVHMHMCVCVCVRARTCVYTYIQKFYMDINIVMVPNDSQPGFLQVLPPIQFTVKFINEILNPYHCWDHYHWPSQGSCR